MNPPPPSEDTYCILTGHGPAAIAIIAARGPRVAAFLDQHIRRTAHDAALGEHDVRRAALLDEQGETIDDVLITGWRGGASADVRIHLHGNPWLVRRCAELLEARGLHAVASDAFDAWRAGDRLDAEAANLAPRMLTYAGVAWLARQPARLRSAVAELIAIADDSERRRRGAAIAEGLATVAWFAQPIRVAVVGPPNAGKSTLVNALVDHPVSITSSVPGTTRDYVEALDEIAGWPVAWLDTAGLRPSGDPLEWASMEQTRRLAAVADVVVLVLEGAGRPTETNLECLGTDLGRPVDVVALNKCDVVTPGATALDALRDSLAGAAIQAVSALTRAGLGELRLAVVSRSGREVSDSPAAFTPRQVAALRSGDRGNLKSLM